MRVLRCALLSLTLSAAAVSRVEPAQVYTDQASFLNAVQSGYYLENFDSLPPFPPPPLFFSSNGFSYTAETDDDSFFTLGGALSTDHQAFDIRLELTSNNITAIGGTFFLGSSFTNPGAILNLNLDDGTTVTLTDPVGGTFIGFTSAVPIQSLTLGTPTIDRFVGVDNLITGSAVVPEPKPITLWILGIAVVYFLGRLRALRPRV